MCVCGVPSGPTSGKDNRGPGTCRNPPEASEEGLRPVESPEAEARGSPCPTHLW